MEIIEAPGTQQIWDALNILEDNEIASGDQFEIHKDTRFPEIVNHVRVVTDSFAIEYVNTNFDEEIADAFDSADYYDAADLAWRE